MSISDIRDGLATNLATISGLRTAADLPDNPSPPIAVVQLNNVSYDQAFKQGLALYSFTITVIVGRVSERTAQARLNAYASTGAGGIKQACIILSMRQFKRYDSPTGVMGFGDLGVMRVGRVDPDVELSLIHI